MAKKRHVKKTAKKKPHTDTHVVVQEGGSSCELYASVYNSGDDAQDAVNRHAASSYNAFGPYKVSRRLARLSDDTWREIGELIEKVAADVMAREHAVVEEPSSD